jgi:hypothetical protein
MRWEQVPIAECFFVVALLVILALFIVDLLRSGRPDPKMAFLMNLMRDFPKDQKRGPSDRGPFNGSESNKEPDLEGGSNAS